ncbi:palmitoyltransferase ERF2 [Xylaria sp. CBS 124048]|nr:palmitoyltransferase ERF2 [Xylaria sp. CBS 124048]
MASSSQSPISPTSPGFSDENRHSSISPRASLNPTSTVPNDDKRPNSLFPRAPASVVSSRMTDIASQDGDAPERTERNRKKSHRISGSRPGTAKTGWSASLSAGGSHAQPLRQSMQRASINGSIASSRPLSSGSKTSRSHVPLASHAFFRPMSSQKLQAQRGVTRLSSLSQQRPPSIDDLPDEDDQSHIAPHHVFVPETTTRNGQPTNNHENMPVPPSRDTERTESFGHATAATSPTHAFYHSTSVADSTRPLHQKQSDEQGLSLNLDVGSNYLNVGNTPTSPVKPPRSFTSSLFLSGTGEPAATRPTHNMHGAEKLSSGASSPRLAASVPQKPDVKTQETHATPGLGRNHEYFEGNTVFCLNGRLQNTRHRPINVGTGFLIVLPAALFFGGCAPYLWHHLSPAVPVVFAYIFFIAMSSFLRASASDPGILPRNLHQFPPLDDNEDPLRLAPPTNDWTLIKSAESNIAAMEVPTKFCRSCNIWRPPRAHHCRLCDNCVEAQDHHCVWVNNCVGRRNYRYFFTFVTSTTIMGLYLIGAALAQIVIYSHEEGVSFGQAANHFRIALALVVYGFLGFLYPVALTGYHLFLIARGETTREFLNSHKLLKKDRYRAFTQGNILKNWIVVLCRPRPPTYYRFKDHYEAGDQRLGVRRNLREIRTPLSNHEVELHAVRPFQGPVSLQTEITAAPAAPAAH